MSFLMLPCSFTTTVIYYHCNLLPPLNVMLHEYLQELLKRHVFSYKGRIDLDHCDVINVPDGKGT